MKKVTLQSPTYVKTFVQLVQPLSLKTYRNPGKITQQGFGLEKVNLLSSFWLKPPSIHWITHLTMHNRVPSLSVEGFFSGLSLKCQFTKEKAVTVYRINLVLVI